MKAGDTFYIQRLNFRGTATEEPEPITVSKVGVKYLTFAVGRQIVRFDKESLLYDGDNARYLLYRSMQHYLDKKEEAALKNWFWKIRDAKLTIEQLRAIKAIIEPDQ